MIRTDASRPIVQWNARKRFGLASVHKVLILVAYAKLVVRGEIDPAERVRVAEIERWYWPHTDGGAHEAAVADWRNRGEIRGSGSSSTVQMSEVAHAMVRWSDNAATDYLLRRTGGSDAVLRAAREIGYGGTLAPPSVFGAFVMWATAPTDWLKASPAEQVALADEAASATTAAHAASLSLPSIASQARLAAATFQGTPREWVTLMAAIEREVSLGTERGIVLSEVLEWPMEFGSNRASFDAYGTKGGSLPGIVTEASFFAVADDERYAVVLFFRDLRQGEQAALLQGFAHQEFMRQAVTNPGFRADVCSALSGP